MNDIKNFKVVSLTILAFLCHFQFNLNAQNDTMYVMKNGTVIGKHDLNADIDSIIFYRPIIDSNVNNGGNGLSCEDIPWNENINYGSVSDIDENEYRTVIIGNQEWMAENLKSTHFANGDEIPNVKSESLWSELESPAWCSYIEYSDTNNDNIFEIVADYQNCYGNLYNSFAANDSRNVCPTGWRPAQVIDWERLIDAAQTNGYQNIEEVALNSISGWGYDGSSSMIQGQDILGFRSLPGGKRYLNGNNFGSKGGWSFYHPDTQFNSSSFYIGYGGNGAEGRSVRCVKD